ncbi:hypothetical protein CEXT_138621 [Caerostris extrusa]|uniref:Uncharacterized protein n=1 Tax=Caerostris extrusa TaxID=172846 RepID=A0AAV4VPP0_CAEEX|nr:hypothetical protein CEXT_138621 [Caerostris extrusa]
MPDLTCTLVRFRVSANVRIAKVKGHEQKEPAIADLALSRVPIGYRHRYITTIMRKYEINPWTFSKNASHLREIYSNNFDSEY